MERWREQESVTYPGHDCPRFLQPSTRRWWGHLAHQPEHFSRLGVAPLRLLGENATPVNLNFEHPAGRLDQLHVGLGVGLADFGRQTGGPRLVVSDDAVFDRNAHAVNDSRA